MLGGMNFEPFDADELQRILAGTSRRSYADLRVVAALARRCCSVLLAAVQSAIQDADAAQAMLEAAHADGDGTRIAQALARWRQALDTARRTSTEATNALRKMLADPVVAKSAALPHVQAATAVSTASVADLERRWQAGPGSVTARRVGASARPYQPRHYQVA